jgi:uncharacterized phage infection (PIP) family protein YhgE
MKRNFKHALSITVAITAAAILDSARPLPAAQTPAAVHNKQPANNGAAGELDGAFPSNGTNGITARIQADLDSVKNKINAAVKTLQEAVASNQEQRAMSVSNVAAQIRGLASTDLGDGSALVRETDKLITKMRAQINQGRMLAADPKEDARDSYAQGLLTLEPELSRLIDRRTSVARVRNELLRQASALESRAKAIAWLEESDQMKVASKALEEALSEALAFAGRIDALIGRGAKLAVE